MSYLLYPTNRASLHTVATQTATHSPTPHIARPVTRSPRPETRTSRRTRSLTRAAHTLRAVMHKLRAQAHSLSPGAHTHTLRPESHRANMYPQTTAAHTLRVLTHTRPGWWRRTSTPRLATTSGVMLPHHRLSLILCWNRISVCYIFCYTLIYVHFHVCLQFIFLLLSKNVYIRLHNLSLNGKYWTVSNT